MLKKLICLLLTCIPVAALATPGAYVQGEAGTALVNMPSSISILPGLGYQVVPTGRLSLGYLWGDNHFNYGLESGLQFYNASADSQTTFFGTYKEHDSLNGYNLDLLGVLKYTFDCGFNVFGKAGAAYVYQRWDRTITLNGARIDSLSTSKNSGVVSPELAMGIGYQFTPHWGMTFTTDVITDSPKSQRIGPRAITSALLGISYSFG
jgi:outer membrane immunogenic protein